MAANPEFIYGTDGDDELILDAGLTGTLIGLLGNDTYFIHSTNFAIVEQPGGGTDTVRTDLSGWDFWLPDNVENLLFLSTSMDGPFYATGNALANTIQGGSSSDELDGGAGNDTLIGGLGADTYNVDSAGDKVIENPGDLDPMGVPHRDTVWATVSYILPANVEDLYLDGESGMPNSNGTGNALGNTIAGTDGNNTLSGLAGDDELGGGYGNDTLLGGDGNDELQGGNDNDTLDGGAGNDLLSGGFGKNTLKGGAGNDDLYANWQDRDTLAGNAGNDTYHLIDLSFGATIVEAAGEGTDTVETDAPIYTLPANVEVLRYVGDSVATLTGNSGNNWLYGGDVVGSDTLFGLAGNDYLDGGEYWDRMEGGTGNDSYFVGSGSDIVVELTGAGTDTVFTDTSYALPDNVENLTMIAFGFSVVGIGNALGNVLIGNGDANRLEGGAGNDTLDGGAGNDTLVGGAGNDTFMLDSFADQVVELGGEGTDSAILKTSGGGTYWLAANLENLQVLGSQPWFSVTLYGNDSNNRLVSGAGYDTLDGGLGADRLEGGAGNDTYYVDQSGDVVVEAAGQGHDIIRSSVNNTLAANTEWLVLLGSALIGTGNALNNTLWGNALGNTLSGGAGDDSLFGDAGNDTLNGGDGKDSLNGGAGNDPMSGGGGDDSYYVDSFGDSVSESAGGGIDKIFSTVFSIGLFSQVENLDLVESSLATIGYGNGLGNVITGNSRANILNGFEGNDWLDGGAGNDTMAGNGGDDTFVVSNAGDLVYENPGEGNDTIRAYVSLDLSVYAPQVENLVLLGAANGFGYGTESKNTLTGDGTNNTLLGLGGNDRLVGSAGNDFLGGGSGADTMIGGPGNDEYSIDNAGDVVTELTNEGIDTISSDMANANLVLPANVENGSLFNTSGKLTGNALDNLLYAEENGSTILDGGAGNDTLYGSETSDTLTGGAGNDLIGGSSGNDTLDGGAGNDVLDGAIGDDTTYWGNDVMKGGAGDDVYHVDSGNEDQVIEAANAGIDTVTLFLQSNYVLPANVENIVIGSHEGGETVTGNGLNNDMRYDRPTPAAITFNGGAGADRLNVDLYAGFSLSTAGIETVLFDVNLASVVTTGSGMSGVSEVTMTGAGNVTLPAIGGTAAGMAPRYVFNQYSGTAALAVVGAAGSGSDFLNIELNNTYLLDLQLADVETLIFNSRSGFPSDNVIQLDLVTGLPDVVVTGGATLGITDGIASIDTLTLDNYTGAQIGLTAGTPAAAQTVNLRLANTVVTEFHVGGLGTDADTVNINTLSGSTSRLLLSGESSADTFTLNGSGNLVLASGSASTFSVNNFSGSLRAVFDGATSFSVGGAANGRYDLTAGSATDTFAFGTSLDGLDRMDGGNGGDSLSANISGLTFANGALHIANVLNIGFTVNSATSIDAAGIQSGITTVNGTGALTVVNASGNWNASGLTGPLNLTALYATVTGTSAADTIINTGSGSGNTFYGKGGNDALAGGAGGNDTFVFDTALSGTTNVDTILDFETGDKIHLENAIFTALVSAGPLAAGNFLYASGITETSGADANDYIKYNTSTGALYYDTNGNGSSGMTQFAVVNFGAEHPVLTSADFLVI